MVDGALFDAKRMGDFKDSQALLFQGPCSRRRGLGCARSPSGVGFSGESNERSRSEMRVPDNLKKCVAFLGCAKADGTPVFVGSALFLGDDTDEPPLTYLITARHVIDRIKNLGVAEVLVRINTKSGTAGWTSVGFDHWLLPDPGSSLDVALARVGIPDGADHLLFPRSRILTASLVNELDIGVGEEVFITGLFAHHTGDLKNVPIVRVGNLASYPSEQIQAKGFGRMEAYLMEARSIGGLSGSPVFVHTGTMRIIGGQLKIAQEPMFYLAGLVHGHYDEGCATEKNPSAIGGRKEAVNTGIAIVVPIEKILKFLDAKKLSTQRAPA
jgi:hypothetical protein